MPWDQIVKAYEYDKGSYVVLDEDDLRAAAPEGREAVEVEGFVELAGIGPQFFERPYVLVPDRKAEKGYVLLRDTLAASGRAGIARVVIRTREYLAAVLPQGDALILILLRFPQELVEPDEYRLPSGSQADYRIGRREMEMAAQLIDSMTVPWSPGDYRDDYRERLHAVIEKRLRSRKGVVAGTDEEEPRPREGTATNVVDFMSLLEQSIRDNRRTPPAAGKAAGKTGKRAPAKAARAGGARKGAARKVAGKTTSGKKAAGKTVAKNAGAGSAAGGAAKGGRRRAKSR